MKTFRILLITSICFIAGLVYSDEAAEKLFNTVEKRYEQIHTFEAKLDASIFTGEKPRYLSGEMILQRPNKWMIFMKEKGSNRPKVMNVSNGNVRWVYEDEENRVLRSAITEETNRSKRFFSQFSFYSREGAVIKDSSEGAEKKILQVPIKVQLKNPSFKSAELLINTKSYLIERVEILNDARQVVMRLFYNQIKINQQVGSGVFQPKEIPNARVFIEKGD